MEADSRILPVVLKGLPQLADRAPFLESLLLRDFQLIQKALLLALPGGAADSSLKFSAKPIEHNCTG